MALDLVRDAAATTYAANLSDVEADWLPPAVTTDAVNISYVRTKGMLRALTKVWLLPSLTLVLQQLQRP